MTFRIGLAGAALILAASTSAAAIDLRFYHKLSTDFRGIDMPLDIYNGGPKNNRAHLAPAANVSGQLWRLTPANGPYRLSTQFRGAAMCLDVMNGGPNNNMVHLAPCGNYSGQFWRLNEEREGVYRLTTEFRGPGMCLDVVNGGPNNNDARLAPCGNYSGQFWTVRGTWTEAN